MFREKDREQLRELNRLLTKQQETIINLTRILKNSVGVDGTLFYSNNDKTPVVIQNGEIVSNDHMTDCKLDWHTGDIVSVTVEYE